jgi:phage terminase small subunit
MAKKKKAVKTIRGGRGGKGKSSKSKLKSEERKAKQGKPKYGPPPEVYDGSAPLKSLMQEMFVSKLLQGMNHSEAYRQSGYRGKRPDSQAHQLMRNSGVQARLAYRRAELAEKMGISEERVVGELAKIAFANMQDFVATDADGEFYFKDWGNLSRDQLAAVESVKVTTTTTRNKKGDTEYLTRNVTFKLHNKPQTLEQLGRHLGLFEVDNTQKRQIQINMLKFFIGNGDGRPTD